MIVTAKLNFDIRNKYKPQVPEFKQESVKWPLLGKNGREDDSCLDLLRQFYFN